ncbi:M23 family metallopeptidase [Opitutales bacterium]|nr:M23 family metallopeptidase [Opitutales bacterium]
MNSQHIYTMRFLIAVIVTLVTLNFVTAQKENATETVHKENMLTPAYYQSNRGDPFRAEVERFISISRKEDFHHPLMNEIGQIPSFQVPRWGTFGAGKGPIRELQHHPAVDFTIGDQEAKVTLYASYEGRVTTFKDSPKYGHYLAITKDVMSEDGELLGKLVTIYGHIDLDLDESKGLFMDGKRVQKGELISRHLHSDTARGAHLHYEIRYYRAGDSGEETFYGLSFPRSKDKNPSKASAEPWVFGYWNPKVGYGFADPRNHGIICD